jgi:hypothetical protein
LSRTVKQLSVPENSKLQNGTNRTIVGATKVKMAAPKSKYIEHLLMATQVFSSSECQITTGGGSRSSLPASFIPSQRLYLDGTNLYILSDLRLSSKV